MVFAIRVLISYFFVFFYLFITDNFLYGECINYRHVQCVEKIIAQIVPELEKELGLYCVEQSESCLSNVSEISITFHALRRATIEEARELHVRCTEKLLAAVNQDLHIRGSLTDYPLKGIDVSIGFRSPSGISYADGTVAHIFQVRGDICYYLRHPTQEFYAPFLREPYEKALEIVKASSRTNADLRVHHGQPYEKDLDVVFAEAGKAISKKWKAQLVQSGGDLSDGIKEFAFLFHKYKKVDVAQARKLELGIMEIILEKINSHAQLRPYLTTYPVKPEQVKVLVEFKGSDGFDQDGEDRLSSVRYENNVLQYCMLESRDKDVFRIKPIVVREESYQEAAEAVKGNKTKPDSKIGL